MLRSAAAYTLGDEVKSYKEFIQVKINTVKNELDTSHAGYLTRERHSAEEQELMVYHDQLRTDLQREIRYQETEAAALAAKRNNPRVSRFKSMLDTTKNIFIHFGYVVGVIEASYDSYTTAIGVPPATGAVGVIEKSTGALLGLAASAVLAIQEMHDTWNDDQLQQRKTRYGANLATLALFGLGIAGMAGVAASVLAAPITLPLMLIGAFGVGYYKNSYIYKRASDDIFSLKTLVTQKLSELDGVIDHLAESASSEGQLVSMARQDLKVQRLLFQLHSYRIQTTQLELQKEKADYNKKGVPGLIVGIGLMVLGAVFPPAALGLAIAGILVFAGTCFSTFSVPLQLGAQKDYRNDLETGLDMVRVNNTIARSCRASLESRAKRANTVASSVASTFTRLGEHAAIAPGTLAANTVAGLSAPTAVVIDATAPLSVMESDSVVPAPDRRVSQRR